MRQERRRVPPTKILRPARIVTGADNLRWSVDCLVLDVTSLGACVKIEGSSLLLPDEAALTFDGAHTLRPYRVAWQSAESFGVEFLDGKKSSPSRYR